MSAPQDVKVPSPKSDARIAFEDSLKFPLDDFQLEAVEALDTGHSVVVCAPTGSGKTMVAEFAATKNPA